MTTDVYKAPESEILVHDSTQEEFYVVSSTKFFILYFATMGIYSLYWFYKHWAQYKAKHNDNIIPVLRAIFSIFFVHSLFTAIETRLKDIGSKYFLAASLLATGYIILTIVDIVLNRLSAKGIGSPTTDIISLCLFPIGGWILYKAQIAANVACNDHKGDSNRDITGANILWIVLGLALWGFAGLGLYMMIYGYPME